MLDREDMLLPDDAAWTVIQIFITANATKGDVYERKVVIDNVPVFSDNVTVQDNGELFMSFSMADLLSRASGDNLNMIGNIIESVQIMGSYSCHLAWLTY